MATRRPKPGDTEPDTGDPLRAPGKGLNVNVHEVGQPKPETKQKTIEHNLFRAQSAAFMDKRREVLLHGPRGGGKSRVACLIGITHAAIPGNLVILGRKFGADLRQTTLRTLLEPTGNAPAVLPREAYTINWSAREIRILGGGTILWMGLDDESRLGSYEPGCIIIDEAVQITEEDYLMILGGLRNPIDPNPQLILATNPATRSHFLYEKFQPEHPEMRHPGRGCHFLSWSENTTLSAAYIETLADMSPAFRKRFYLGEWGAFEGLIFDNWDGDKHIAKRDPSEFKTWFGGIDDGYTNRFSFGLFGEDSLGRYHLFAETGRPGMLEQDKVRAVLAVLDKFDAREKIEAIYADPAAAGIIGAMRNAELPVVKANNDVLEGIGKVQVRFGVDAALKTPMLTIEPTCQKVISEIEGYVWDKKDDKDQPVKQADHGPDMIRYAVASRDKNTIHVHVFEDAPDTEGAVDRMRALTDPDYQGKQIPERAGWCRVDNEAIWERF